MKNFTLCVFMAMIALTSTAQITITHADYPINLQGNISNFSSIDGSAGNITLPQFGEDMIWDYSGLTFTDDVYDILLPSTNSSVPNASLRSTNDAFDVLGILLPAAKYYRFDSTGLSVVAYEHVGADLPLISITGNTNDTLSVQYSLSNYTEPIYYISFPCNYGDSMTNMAQEHHQYIANVAAFGLVDYEVNQVKTHISEYKVHGWGKLVLNNENAMMNDTFEVLLRQRTTTVIDSFFDAVGNQVPDALLMAFGYTQGGTSTVERNSFHVKDLGNYALTVNAVNGVFVAGNLNRNVFDTQTVNTISTKPNHIPHAVFPNPVRNHQFNIQFEKTSYEDWHFEMVNLTGQIVHQEAFTEGEGTIRQRIQLNPNLPQGIYFYSIRNEFGQVIANGRLML